MSRDLQKQQTRVAILETAQRLFREQGYNKVSTRMISTAANVAVGTLFSHFKDKQALTLALFHDKISASLAAHESSLQQQVTGLDYFLKSADFFYGLYQEDRAFSVALMQNALFDIGFFQQQLEGFIQQVSEKLSAELPNKSDTQRYVIAKAWFGFYIFHLLGGLSQPETEASDWLVALEKDCTTLLSALDFRPPNTK